MATSAEITGRIDKAIATIQTISARASEATITIIKVGKETEALLLEIKSLKDAITNGAVGAELVSAVNRLDNAVFDLNLRVAGCLASAKQVDDKIPDAQT